MIPAHLHPTRPAQFWAQRALYLKLLPRRAFLELEADVIAQEWRTLRARLEVLEQLSDGNALQLHAAGGHTRAATTDA